jgi:hypothetical protein
MQFSTVAGQRDRINNTAYYFLSHFTTPKKFIVSKSACKVKENETPVLRQLYYKAFCMII